jgi:virulence-associated protein VapD
MNKVDIFSGWVKYLPYYNINSDDAIPNIVSSSCKFMTFIHDSGLAEIFKEIQTKDINVVIAGGIFSYFTHSIVEMPDIDLFAITDSLDKFYELIVHMHEVLSTKFNVKIYLKKNAIEYVINSLRNHETQYTLQLISTCFSDISTLLSSFDINITQICFNPQDETMLYTLEAFKGIATNKLVLINRHNSSNYRLKKFMKRGFEYNLHINKVEPIVNKHITNVAYQRGFVTIDRIKKMIESGSLYFNAELPNMTLVINVCIMFQFAQNKVLLSNKLIKDYKTDAFILC